MANSGKAERAVVLVGLKSCDTCRKARKALETAGYDVSFHDLRETPPSRAEMLVWLDAFGPALVNRRSTTWRGLDEPERGRSEIDLLMEHPALMKRPVIVTDAGPHLGWDPAVQQSLLPR